METTNKTGLELIAAERKRQIEVEGWTVEHDAGHGPADLEKAGDYYRALPANRQFLKWPWEPQWFKPTPNDRVRELVKAGALFQAAADCADSSQTLRWRVARLVDKIIEAAHAIDALLPAPTPSEKAR